MDDKTTFFEGFAAQLPEEDFGHYLVYELEHGQERNFEVTPEPVLIGRSEEAELRIQDGLVSSRHCTVALEGAVIMVEDLGSTNGTFVDRHRVSGKQALPMGSALTVGRCRLRHELKSRDEVLRQQRRLMELDRASNYVQSLLPAPIRDGPVRTSWRFIPSAHLGGDAFGYHWLDEDRFAFYLLDVCGHGAGAALHSVAVLNFLRRGNLPGLDLSEPETVLAELNSAFPMEECGGMYFTIWYGIFHKRTRWLSFASAGHPPAYLRLPRDPDLRPLHTPNLAAGMLSESLYDADSTIVPPGGRLFVFSDGVFEFFLPGGEPFSFDDFVPILARPQLEDVSEVARVEMSVRQLMASENFPDDFSLLVVEFP